MGEKTRFGVSDDELSVLAESYQVEELRYVIFAGVNGAGKSTLFHSMAWSEADRDASLPRVNPDEILVAHGWSSADPKCQLESAKEALQLIRSNFQNRISFNQETTLTGRTVLRNIKTAKNLGYEICLHYVGVEDAGIACARVAHRSAKGGHDIEPKVIQRRYGESLENLIKVMPLCDRVCLYDNSASALQFIACKTGEYGVIEGHTAQNISWCTDAFRAIRDSSRPKFGSYSYWATPFA